MYSTALKVCYNIPAMSRVLCAFYHACMIPMYERTGCSHSTAYGPLFVLRINTLLPKHFEDEAKANKRERKRGMKIQTKRGIKREGKGNAHRERVCILNTVSVSFKSSPRQIQPPPAQGSRNCYPPSAAPALSRSRTDIQAQVHPAQHIQAR